MYGSYNYCSHVGFCHSLDLQFVHLQYTGSRSGEESSSDAYTDLGNLSPMDLISFAYQIASGMVSNIIHINL